MDMSDLSGKPSDALSADELRAENRQLREDLRKLRDATVKLRERYSALAARETQAAFDVRSSDANADSEEAERLLARVSALTRQLAQKGAECAALREQMAAHEASIRERASEHATQAVTQDQFDRLLKENEALRAERDEALERLTGRPSDELVLTLLEEEADAPPDPAVALANDLAIAQAGLMEAADELRERNRKLVDLEQRLVQWRETVAARASEVENDGLDSDRSDQQHDSESEDARRLQVEQMSEELSEEKLRQAVLVERVQALENERTDLLARIERSERLLDESQTIREAQTHEQAQLSETCERLRTELDAARTQTKKVADLEAANERLQTERDMARASLDAQTQAQAQKSLEQSDERDRDNECAVLQQRAQQVDAVLQSLQRHLARVLGALAQKEGEAAAAIEAVRDLKESLRERDREIVTLQSSLTARKEAKPET
jgi:chromosome segregation ATPase